MTSEPPPIVIVVRARHWVYLGLVLVLFGSGWISIARHIPSPTNEAQDQVFQTALPVSLLTPFYSIGAPLRGWHTSHPANQQRLLFYSDPLSSSSTLCSVSNSMMIQLEDTPPSGTQVRIAIQPWKSCREFF